MCRLLIGILVFASILMSASTYEDSIRAWQKQRDAGLRAQDSWLTLVGLFWLKPGENTIGSAPSNDFVLPKGSAPGTVGRLRLEGGKVTFTGVDGVPRSLSYNEEKPDVVHAGTVSFYVIKRGDQFAVRAKDSASTTVLQKEQFRVKLFCGQTVCAGPAREALRGIHGWPGASRGAY